MAGLILAAGSGERLGGASKPLLAFHGATMLGAVLEVAREAGLDPLYVVVGHRSAEVRRSLEGRAVRVVENRDHRSGLASSLAAGATAVARDEETVAACVLLADEPGIRADDVRAVVRAWQDSPAPAARAVYRDRPGHPVVLDRSLFQELSRLEGDAGARALLERPQSVAEQVRLDRRAPVDVDTRADYERALEARDHRHDGSP